MNSSDDGDNFEAFRDCLSVSVVAKLSSPSAHKPKKRSARKRKNSRDNDRIESLVSTATEVASLSDLSEFIEVGSRRQSTDVLLLNEIVPGG